LGNSAGNIALRLVGDQRRLARLFEQIRDIASILFDKPKVIDRNDRAVSFLDRNRGARDANEPSDNAIA
jgi:hypothetical protein